MDTRYDPGALTRASAVRVAESNKAGTWDAVEALAVLAISAQGTPDAAVLLERAAATAEKLKAGSWESVRALAWLSRAQTELRG
ncbi:hypothetical protein [Demequina sp. NBRC 110057]|uniref:hypothetical protein n=1 Tax=Demequina sp. NBRC 110057 TaxID=1570346 RepID=UPI0009FFA8C0|nr:hypothetical protein [Demequina sp. NBRC 110057]